jgi:hypothetical protein
MLLWPSGMHTKAKREAAPHTLCPPPCTRMAQTLKKCLNVHDTLRNNFCLEKRIFAYDHDNVRTSTHQNQSELTNAQRIFLTK